jgi:hypothetical protein
MTLPDWAFWLALFIMLIGLAGTVLPALPGLTLIWIVALVYALAERFATVDPWTFAGLTILAVVGMVADYLLGQAIGRVAGASWRALATGMIGGTIGFAIGLFVGGIGAVPGGVLGTLIGILAVEWMHRKDLRQAVMAGGGWLVGCVLGRGFQFAIAAAMVVLFAWQAGWRGLR